MRDANAMDGAVGITQSPIQLGQTFMYDFTVDPNQKGTFWYHAHNCMQRADGLYGGLAIHEPMAIGRIEDVESQHLLLLGDWYHRPADAALTAYMHPIAFGLETVPDSILANAVGAFNFSDAVPSRLLDCLQRQSHGLSALRLYATKRNLIHLVNVGAYSGLSVAIEGTTMTPLQVDGRHAVAGLESRSVDFLHVGERIDLLALPEATHTNARSHLTITLDEDAYKYQNPALTAVHHFPVQRYGVVATPAGEQANMAKHCNVESLHSAHDQSTLLPPAADQTFVYAMIQKLAHLENEPRGFLNHTTWRPQAPPLLGTSRETWDQDQFVPCIKYIKHKTVWVDLVLNNLNEESHSFHLHGHDFWVLSKYTSTSNWGSYNPFEYECPPGGAYELAGALKKDTVLVPRRGYVVLRFRADNPGIWMFHCRVLWHQGSGMNMAFEVEP